MIKLSLDRQWQFKPAVTANDWWRQSEAVLVDLPHDFSISQPRNPHTKAGASNGFFPGGLGTYEKTLHIPEEWNNKKLMLEFEGVYMNTTVHFNNQIVAKHPYGYTSFHCDLTPYLLYSKDNQIKVTVNNDALPNTRWYSGSGIYRHVWLLIGEPVHIEPWGVFVTTPEVSERKSSVLVKTSIVNGEPDTTPVLIRNTLLTDSGDAVAQCEMIIDAKGSSTTHADQNMILAPARLWSLEDPYLYKLKSEILKDGLVLDSTETSIGIRSVALNATDGLRLNNIPVKLKGGCVHHDCGLIGSAAYDRAEERKVELLLSNGFNAVRCAHNPPSPAFLNACDRLGMLVIDEAFDCWREAKNPNDYSVYFDQFWKLDLESMVIRDRNHPSVIMWSTGNEIVERDGRSSGYRYAAELADFVRKLDDTRPVVNALCGIHPDKSVASIAMGLDSIPDEYDYFGQLSAPFAEPLDVAGYNYLLSRYEKDHEKFPNRIICGTETFPMEVFDCWEATMKLPYVIGDFVWTAIDYLGEAGIGHVWYKGEKSFLGEYPWHQAYCGDIDICGFKRPQSYYRDCVWGLSKAPYIAVHKPEHHGKTADISAWGWPDVVSSWTWNGFEGKPIVVDVYSRSGEVELILNGRLIGRKNTGKENKYMASFELSYEPGELLAIGYDNGLETSRTELKTAGDPATIRLTPDRSELCSKFGDLSYITVELFDAQGNPAHNATNSIYFTVFGEGSLLAVGNSNPLSEEMYTGNYRKVHEGKAMIVVRTNGNPGNIYVTASAESIPTTTVTLKT